MGASQGAFGFGGLALLLLYALAVLWVVMPFFVFRMAGRLGQLEELRLEANRLQVENNALLRALASGEPAEAAAKVAHTRLSLRTSSQRQ